MYINNFYLHMIGTFYMYREDTSYMSHTPIAIPKPACNMEECMHNTYIQCSQVCRL